MTSEEIQDYVWSWCLNHGLNENATAGIMGNISQESAWNPSSIEEGNGIGFGLIQWSFTRRTQLEAFGTDLEHQMYFMWSELTGDYPETGANKQWINASGYTYSNFYDGNYNPQQSASAFCWCFERPNSSEANEAYRQSEAQKFYDKYTGTIPVAPPPYPDPPPAETGNVYRKLITTSYNLNKINSEQTTIIKTLSFNDTIKLRFTFNHRKSQIGINFLGKRLTFDNNTYIIKDVRNDGLIVVTTSGSVCYKNVDPRYVEKVV